MDQFKYNLKYTTKNHHSADSTGEKSAEKRPISASKAAETNDMTSEAVRARHRRKNSTPIGKLPTTSTTPVPVKSAEKQLKSSQKEVKVEEKFDSLAFGNESAEVGKSNSSVVSLQTPAEDVQLSLSTLFDRFDTTLPSELLPDVIELMRNQLENVKVQTSCQQLIGQYSSYQLKRLKYPLRRSLTDILWLAVKLHNNNSLIVEGFCDFLTQNYGISEGKIDLYLEYIDSLLKIICDDINMTSMARKSALKLLETIAGESNATQRRLIAEKDYGEKICLSIRIHLEMSEEGETVEIGWKCLKEICVGSVGIQKRFLKAGGIGLFQLSYEKLHSQANLVHIMTELMWDLSWEVSIRQQLMVNDNLAFLWQIWRETDDKDPIGQLIAYRFAQIFNHFLSAFIWPLGSPTTEQVRMKLKDVVKVEINQSHSSSD